MQGKRRQWGGATPTWVRRRSATGLSCLHPKRVHYRRRQSLPSATGRIGASVPSEPCPSRCSQELQARPKPRPQRAPGDCTGRARCRPPAPGAPRALTQAGADSLRLVLPQPLAPCAPDSPRSLRRQLRPRGELGEGAAPASARPPAAARGAGGDGSEGRG